MHATVFKDLERMLGRDAVSREERDRLVYSRDMWPRSLILLRSGVDRVYSPDAIVWPGSVEDVAQVVRYAAKRGIPIVPFGGGSGVCGGAVPRGGGLVVDMKRMDRIGKPDAGNRTVDVQSGVVGQHLEDALNAQGFTAGHFPASIWCSTFGGWMAARGAGQCSSLYGKIEDMISRARVVTPDGEVREARGFPGRAPGPGWLQAILGSEGILGIVTDGTIRIHGLPERRVMRGLLFPGLREGVDCMRELMRMGLRPAVLRLYDPIDTLVARMSHGSGRGPRLPERVRSLLKEATGAGLGMVLRKPSIFGPMIERASRSLGKGVLMILIFEGPGSLPDDEMKLALSCMLERRGEDLGHEPAQSWYGRRYAVSFWPSKVFAQGAFLDTFEVSGTWDRVLPMYRGVVGAIGDRALVMAHMSHAYRQGCSIYFTFLARAQDDEAMLRLYDSIWEDGLAAAQAAGGAISHHHGIGMSKSAAMRAELGGGLEVLEALKESFDPREMMNPAKLLPD